MPNIAKVNSALPGNKHPVSIYRWYHLDNADLVRGEKNVSPLNWLQSGFPVDEVISAAKHL